MAGFIKFLSALLLSALALAMPNAGKAGESNVLYPANASPAPPDILPAAPRPSFHLCFQMPRIEGPASERALRQNRVVMAVTGCNGAVDLNLHLVNNAAPGSPIVATYAITSLPWSREEAVKDGAYTLFLQNGGNTSQYDSLHFDVITR